MQVPHADLGPKSHMARLYIPLSLLAQVTHYYCVHIHYPIISYDTHSYPTSLICVLCQLAGSPCDTSSVVSGLGSDEQVRVGGAVESPPLAASGECGVLCPVGGAGRHTSASPSKQQYKGRREKHEV